MSTNPHPLRFHRYWLAIGWALAALLIVFSLIPSPPDPLQFSGSDKVEHALAYGLLMGWFMQIRKTHAERARIALALIWLGIGVEIGQAFTASRYYEAADMAANGAGVLVTWMVLRPPWTELLVRLERWLGPR